MVFIDVSELILQNPNVIVSKTELTEKTPNSLYRP